MVRLSTLAALYVVIFGLAGCELRPRVLSAEVQRLGDNEQLRLAISSNDANLIKKRQIYFSIYITKCGAGNEYYPVQPYIDGKMASYFDFVPSHDGVTISGTVPVSILEGYEPSCATLSGAGYFTGRLKSAPISIRRVKEK